MPSLYAAAGRDKLAAPTATLSIFQLTADRKAIRFSLALAGI
jgi:hypothetical protein